MQGTRLLSPVRSFNCIKINKGGFSEVGVSAVLISVTLIETGMALLHWPPTFTHGRWWFIMMDVCLFISRNYGQW